MKIIKILSIIFALSFFVQSCDKIQPPYKDGEGIDCEAGNQNVLIEDYTGHTCVNCPGAAQTAHEIKELCEDRVVIIAVHTGYFAEPKPDTDYSYDFRTETGNEWADFFNVASYPNGVVNRINQDGNYILSPGQWTEASTELLNQSTPVDIEIENSFDNNILTTKIDASFIDDVEGDYNLIVCLTEDNIIKPQKNNVPGINDGQDIEDYHHMHVLRTNISQSWGESFINGNAASGETITKSFALDFTNTDWVVENCNVVAFISNANDKSVLQVKETKVIE